ncbi:MAG: GDP-fucose synthetase [Candidatus Magasanikbacteria bacterium RIFOXYC2_FULL_42_28]|uniref:GDP-L-fucose synthase n=1 Tax=Candidatus Magasanikbacteria bacterium RIFOXYC2_FULL_42_28 TaxID=1798704 RepID=A0A1F6NXU0_9BACT|nr:MAG: GDP-fucose synthetase [Candidatus Magasanikbacteria bacterium RIFOXYC2_FULL_42_28]
MEKNSKIYVAGHRGLVGSAIVRKLLSDGYKNLVLKTHQELDLLDQRAVADFFAHEPPQYVFLAAARVGGIVANSTYHAQFIYENLQIQNNIIHNAYLNKIKKLLFLGSSCIYPKACSQPIKEEYLLTGPLEQTNEPYAIAKIAGLKMCQSYNRQYGTNFIAAMPTNLYGVNDNFDLKNSHVLPALLRKFHDAKVSGLKEVEAWGTGKPRREFLNVGDMADGCLFLMNNFNPTQDQNEQGHIFVNLGTGTDLTIKELVELIKNAVGFEGEIIWDKTKPDGTSQKLLDVSKIMAMGWKPKIELRAGVVATYEWYKKQDHC